MAELLDLRDGIFHVQYRLDKGKPLIMECMRRCLGNFSLRAASAMLGYKIEDYIAKAHCGYSCEDIPHICNVDDGYYSHFYIQPPKDGIVKNVVIDKELEPYIYDSIQLWKPGFIVDNYKVQMLGFLFLKFPSKEIRDDIASRYQELIKIDY